MKKTNTFLIIVTGIIFSIILLNPAGATNSESSTEIPLTAGIGKLVERNENTKIKYDRDYFNHWVTSSKYPECSTRYEVLIDEGKNVKVSKGCFVTGTWYSYYDNKTFTDPRKLDIDHMVPLHEAWKSGAYAWDEESLKQYANDTQNKYSLVAVSAQSNRGKSDKDPDSWLPTFEKCRYISEWVEVKLYWKLTVDKAEKQSLLNESRKCSKNKVKIYQ